jgi:hypothetical protein
LPAAIFIFAAAPVVFVPAAQIFVVAPAQIVFFLAPAIVIALSFITGHDWFLGDRLGIGGLGDPMSRMTGEGANNNRADRE